MSETTTTTEQTPTAQPVWKRNADGFIEGITYHKGADGKVDWRKMVKPEFLVVNKDNFLSKGKEVPESIEGLEDKDLLILLGGIRDLAILRGFIDVDPVPIVSSPTFASVKTTIKWMPNIESGGIEQSFGDIASAHERNTKGFAVHYLESIAANRAYVRAVRNYLGIKIVGQDEVGADLDPKENTNSQGKPIKFLEGVLKRNNVAFESFKNRMIQQEVEGASDWTSLKDVPAEMAMELAEKVLTLVEAAKAAAAKKS